MMKKLDMIVDLQFGSTGKGLIAGYLAETAFDPLAGCHNAYPGGRQFMHYDTVIGCNMPNAGHTYIDSKGQKMIHKVLPNGIVSPALRTVMLGPGSVFSVDQLIKEICQARQFGYLPAGVEIMIHPNATILAPMHRDAEQATLSGISSTMQGSMAAMVHKMRRDIESSPIARDSKDDRIAGMVCTQEEWIDALQTADNILGEGSQGYSLGINTQFYPFTTSRDCTPSRFLSDMGVPHNLLRRVIGTARTYPIRVGNTADGFSGNHYPDQRETSWAELGQPEEKTTVTQRVRRVFTFSMEQIKEAVFHCAPDEIFLNFCNYMTEGEYIGLGSDIQEATGIPVIYCGHGPAYGDVTDGRYVQQVHSGS